MSEERNIVPKILMTNEGSFSGIVVLNDEIAERFTQAANLRTHVTLRRVGADLMPTRHEAIQQGDILIWRRLALFQPGTTNSHPDRRTQMNLAAFQATVYIADQEMTRKARQKNNGRLNEEGYAREVSHTVCRSLEEVLRMEKPFTTKLGLRIGGQIAGEVIGGIAGLAGGLYLVNAAVHHYMAVLNSLHSEPHVPFLNELKLIAIGGQLLVGTGVFFASLGGAKFRSSNFREKVQQHPYLGSFRDLNPLKPLVDYGVGVGFLLNEVDNFVKVRE